MRKRKGNLFELLSSLTVVIALTIIMLVYLNIVKLADCKESIDQLARKYILEMEAEGYLSASGQTQFLQQLKQLGIEEVDLTGTTFSQAGYGNAVYLKLQCHIPAKSLNMSGGNMFSFVFEEMKFPVSIQKMSTAKN